MKQKGSTGKTKKIILVITLLIIIIGISISSGIFGLSWKNIGNIMPQFAPKLESPLPSEKVKIISEESVVIDVVKKVSPSVVTVGISKTQVANSFETNPFDPFGIFGIPRQQQQTQPQNVEQDIGSGFIISKDGLIVTNKHVVADTEAKYRIITSNDQSFDVTKIYRDPANDLAILQINALDLTPVELGDSSKLQVGQMAIAIGTALGEFRQTVTRGVISGLGRGITAGSPFEGYVERLDNVIQTDAALNPGNSGGPLLNSGGQVIGVNVAIASSAQNISFAIPINVIKEAIDNFNTTGKFSRPFLGVRYKMINRDLALLNDVPEGAYVVDIVAKSPAEKAGIAKGDILTKFDSSPVKDENGGLATMISKKKVGDSVSIELWRNKETKTVNVRLEEGS